MFTGMLKFAIDNPSMLPAITRLFKRLDVLVVSVSDNLKNFVSLYSTKMTVWFVKLFLSVESLNIVFGIMSEGVETGGNPLLCFFKVLRVLSDWLVLLTMPEKLSPLKFCGFTVCKFISKFLLAISSSPSGPITIDSAKMFRVATILQSVKNKRNTDNRCIRQSRWECSFRRRG